jgi:hypothetical protein
MRIATDGFVRGIVTSRSSRSIELFSPIQSQPHPKQRFASFRLAGRLLCASALALCAQAAWAQKAVPIVLDQEWTDTGISVGRDQPIVVRASGDMNWYTGGCNNNCHSSPDGSLWSQCSAQTPGILAPGLNCWSLIGRVGNGRPFEVGTSLSFQAPAGGELYLGVNDNNYVDNTGSWVATITLGSLGGLTIVSPAQGENFTLFQTNGTSTELVPFVAAGPAGTVSWNAVLEYQTSGGKPDPPYRRPRTFQSPANGEAAETYESQGGKVTVEAQMGSASAGPVIFTVTGTRIAAPAITRRLVNLYTLAGGATPRLMTGVAQVESTYLQFKRRELYGSVAFWPYESISDGGSHIGLMMMPTAEKMDYAWDWQVNVSAGVDLFKQKLAAAKRKMNSIIAQHPGLRTLTPVELERMALLLYGPKATADSSRQYYAPRKSGGRWTWAVNTAGNPMGVAYANSCISSIHPN